MKRWERCGIPMNSRQQSISLLISNSRNFLDGKLPFNGKPRMLGHYEETGGAQDSVRGREIFSLYEILLLNHFQFEHSLGDTRNIIHLLMKFSREYFLGRWIDSSVTGENSPALYKKQISWLDSFRIGILAGVILNDREGLREIASWVDGEFSRDELDYSQADIDYYVVLGKYINHGTIQKSIIDSIMNQRRKRPRFLTEILETIDKRDSKQFVKVFTEYHKLFDKSECDKDVFLLFRNDNINGSVLWNLAKMHGLEHEKFSEEIMDRIITPQSLGLEK